MRRDDLQYARRPLGNSGLMVSPVALGCWPIAGVTTLAVNDADSIATIQKCFDVGVNHLDTAHVYGPNGESENLIRRALAGTRGSGSRRDEMVIATKCGIHCENGDMVTDNRPERLRSECDESLRRLGTDRVELLYLHAPDDRVPLADSAAALRELMEAGKTLSVGVSNFTVEQIAEFHAICPITATQMPYNMLQRDIEKQTIPWCREHNVAVMVYWPLMKGLLAGRLPRDAELSERDSRRKYPMYQGDELERTKTSSPNCGQSPVYRAELSRRSSSTGRSTSRGLPLPCAAQSGQPKSKRRQARWAGNSRAHNSKSSTPLLSPAAQLPPSGHSPDSRPSVSSSSVAFLVIRRASSAPE